MTPERRARIRTICGVIVLSLLSSAIWDLFKPAAIWTGTILMELSTLGLESMRDGVYARARGNENLAWIQASVQATTCMALMIFALGVLYARLVAPTPAVIKVTKLALPPVTIVLMFFWIQYAQTMYASTLVRYRLDLEAIVNVESTDRQIKVRALEVRQIVDRKSYISYTEGLRGIIEQEGKKAPVMKML